MNAAGAVARKPSLTHLAAVFCSDGCMRTATFIVLLFALPATAVAELPPGDGAPDPEGSSRIRVHSDGTVFPPFAVQAMCSRGELVLSADRDAPASSVLALISISCPTPAARLLDRPKQVRIAVEDAAGSARSIPIRLPDEQLPIAAPPFPPRHGILVTAGDQPYRHQVLRQALPVIGHRLDLPRVKKLAAEMVPPAGKTLDLEQLRKAVGNARNESIVLFPGEDCRWGEFLAAWQAFTTDGLMRIAASPGPAVVADRRAWESARLNSFVPAGSGNLPEFVPSVAEVTVGLLEDGTAVLQTNRGPRIEEFDAGSEEKLLARVGAEVSWREPNSYSSFFRGGLVIVARPGVPWRRIAALARLGPTTLVVKGEKSPRSIQIVKRDGVKTLATREPNALWKEVAPTLAPKVVLTD